MFWPGRPGANLQTRIVLAAFPHFLNLIVKPQSIIKQSSCREPRISYIVKCGWQFIGTQRLTRAKEMMSVIVVFASAMWLAAGVPGIAF